MDFHIFPLFPILGAYLLPKQQNNQNNCFTSTNWMKPLSSLTSKDIKTVLSRNHLILSTFWHIHYPKNLKNKSACMSTKKKVACFLRDDDLNLPKKITSSPTHRKTDDFGNDPRPDPWAVRYVRCSCKDSEKERSSSFKMAFPLEISLNFRMTRWDFLFLMNPTFFVFAMDFHLEGHKGPEDFSWNTGCLIPGSLLNGFWKNPHIISG